ncbi:hypothetical protein VPH35_018188 [Triticum aestivum]
MVDVLSLRRRSATPSTMTHSTLGAKLCSPTRCLRALPAATAMDIICCTIASFPMFELFLPSTGSDRWEVGHDFASTDRKMQCSSPLRPRPPRKVTSCHL